jgi:threonylcarbamoyladenosine tRNA methylthiotransferase MtaB
MKRKVAFKTLGCRLNQFETDSVLTDFYKTGYDIVPFNEPADVYVVNTCTVTNSGDHKSRTAINRLFMENRFPRSCHRMYGRNQKEYLENREISPMW